MHNRFDIVVIDKKTSECHLVDIASPVDSMIRLKEREKEENYVDLAFEIKRLWRLRKVRTTTTVIGALGTFSNSLQNCLENPHIGLSIQISQKYVLLGSARILRRTLER